MFEDPIGPRQKVWSISGLSGRGFSSAMPKFPRRRYFPLGETYASAASVKS